MAMGSIDRYVFRTIFGAFVLVLLNLTAVIWITQILKQIDIITNQGQTILVFLRITGLLVPILMLVIAPIAIMIAVCYALTKLNGDFGARGDELGRLRAAPDLSPGDDRLPSRRGLRRLHQRLSRAADPAEMNEAVAKVRTDVVANVVRPGAFTRSSAA